MPLLGNLLIKDTDYQQVAKVIPLTVGKNQIGDVAITLSQTGKALQAEKTERKIINQIFGFRDFRTFLVAGTPFFSLLAFCLFFLWCERQPKTRYLLILKRYTWGLFAFVSLWFIYRFTLPRPAGLFYTLYSLSIYIATGITLAAVYGLYRYYHTNFRRKHNKLARLVSHLFEIRHEHYPRIANRALKLKKSTQETFEEIEEYETQTFTVLDELVDHPQMERPSSKAYKYKLILIGLVLSALAITPLLHQFVPKHVDYIETTQAVSLQPGLNRIGDISLSLSPQGRVLKAQKTERHIIHKVFGFRNLGVFLVNIGPFFTSLSLCLFFFWYEQQEKNRYVLALKWWAWGVFFLVALYFTYWTLVPELDPISNGFYQIGTYAALAISLIALYYLYRHYGEKLRSLYKKLTSLVAYLFQVRNKHYPRMALKAMEDEETREENYKKIQQFDALSTEKMEEIKEFLLTHRPELREQYEKFETNEAYLAYLLYMSKMALEDTAELERVKKQVKDIIYILQDHRENYTEEEIQKIMDFVEELLEYPSSEDECESDCDEE